MRVALVYDCLYPQTVGGAERWLRILAEDLARDHDVTYVTRRQWAPGEQPVPGVRCVGVAPGGDLYTHSGRRRLGPPLRFAAGVLAHFARNRDAYDVVHCLSYPLLPLVALRLALVGRRRPRVVVEWLEWLSADYWREYAGPLGGRAAMSLQRLCLRLTPEAICFSDHVASRLRAAGLRGPLHRLTGLWLGDERRPALPAADPPFILFAGRHVPDKRVVLAPDVLAEARRANPPLKLVALGDGPDRPRLLVRARELGLDGALSAPGFVEADRLSDLFARAACLLVLSRRDGHGMVVAEAAAAGTPSVVVRAADSAAAELVEEGVNGAVADSARPAEVAAAVDRVLAAGPALRERTVAWFAQNRERLSMAGSIARVREIYLGGDGRVGSSSPFAEATLR
jgi:glycosyltransferase involved in cell wall biosynthesis